MLFRGFSKQNLSWLDMIDGYASRVSGTAQISHGSGCNLESHSPSFKAVVYLSCPDTCDWVIAIVPRSLILHRACLKVPMVGNTAHAAPMEPVEKEERPDEADQEA